jgi:homoserine kinase
LENQFDLTKENNLCIKTCTQLLSLFSLSQENKAIPFPGYFKCRMINEIPLSRGLGSSATALIAGGLLAQTIKKLYNGNGNDSSNSSIFEYDKKQLLEYLIKYENHIDNIGASLYGGICIGLVLPSSSSSDNDSSDNKDNKDTVHCMSHLQWNPSIRLLLIIPEDYELQTTKARSVLPKHYSFQDAVRQVQNVSLLVSCLLLQQGKRGELLSESFKDCMHYALKDRFHQPYRQQLIPGLEEILEKVNCRKKYKELIGIVLSGAGPSILVLMDENGGSGSGNSEEVSDECVKVFKKNNIKARVMELGVDTEGSVVMIE